MDITADRTSEENIENLINDDLETISNTEGIEDIDQLIEDTGVFRLPSGNALTLNETYNITAVDTTKFIVLIGPVACGKTTIETTLYQKFQKDSMGEFYFAGSKTIQGYEQRSYYTRTKSKQCISTTQRTSQGVNENILHLKLWNANTKEHHNFLFADLSGEDFENHIAEIELIQKNLSFIKTANYIVAVLDGELLSDKYHRNGVFEQMAQLLRTVFDAGLTTIHTNLQVVISKYDIVDQRCKSDPFIRDFIESKKNELILRLKPYINELEFYDIAAMPENNTEFEIGFGVSELLHSWTKSRKIKASSNNKCNTGRIINSEFDRLAEKILGDINE